MPAKINGTKEKILAAALKCISENGVANVGLREIADEAEVVMSQVSYYFRNKEGLFSEVLHSIKETYLSELRKRFAAADGFEEKLSALLKHNKKVLASKSPSHRTFLDLFNIAMWSPSFKKQMELFLSDIYTAIEIELGLPKKSSIKYRPKELSRLVMAMTFGVSMQNLINVDSCDSFAGFDLLEAVFLKKV